MHSSGVARFAVIVNNLVRSAAVLGVPEKNSLCLCVGNFPKAVLCLLLRFRRAERELFSFDHPGEKRACGNAHGKRGRSRQQRVPLDAPSCIVQEFFRGIAALFRGTPRRSNAVPDGVGDRVRCPRSLLS